MLNYSLPDYVLVEVSFFFTSFFTRIPRRFLFSLTSLISVMTSSLWVDRYRPTSLNKLDFHREQAKWLGRLAQSQDFPHLLVYGPSGAGKKTRIRCILKELFGNGVERLREDHMNFTTPSKKKLEVFAISSNYHVQINPSDAGIHDTVVIQELLKEMAQTQSLDSTHKSFKVVLLMEVDQLTRQAQHALRRTMEKYASSCRLILCGTSISKIIPAIRSRCLGVRVPAPSLAESVCKKESLSLPPELAIEIAKKSKRNLRKALLMCEACRVQQYPFSVDQTIPEAEWEVVVRETANLIIEQQSPQRLLDVRTRLYDLLKHCIPPEVIFKSLLSELLVNCDGELKMEVNQMAAHYEHQMQQGSKHIFHLEAFIAKFMAVYKRFLEAGLLDLF